MQSEYCHAYELYNFSLSYSREEEKERKKRAKKVGGAAAFT